MKKIFILIFLIVTSLICSCNSINNYSSNNKSTISSSPKVSTIISNNDEVNEYHIEKDAISMISFSSRYPIHSNSQSSMYSLSFKVNLANENTIFELNCDNVYFSSENQKGNHIFVKNGTLIHSSKLILDESIYNGFIDIIARIDNNIVGYAVIYIDPIFVVENSIYSYQYLLICSKIFPKISGEYQNISFDYLQNRISTVKSNINTISLSDVKMKNND